MIVSELFSRVFKDKQDRFVLFQKPNLPLLFAIIFLVAGYFIEGRLGEVLRFCFYLSIFIWAGLEAIGGVSTFRRVLGVIGLIYIVISML